MRRLGFATLLVSAAAIGYEILLMRLLSIVQWHHFAWMIISLALLGYGASGTFIALLRKRLEPRFEFAFAAFALLFGVTMLAASPSASASRSMRSRSCGTAGSSCTWRSCT